MVRSPEHQPILAIRPLDKLMLQARTAVQQARRLSCGDKHTDDASVQANDKPL